MSDQDEIRTQVVASCRAVDATYQVLLETIKEVARELAGGRRIDVDETYDGARAHCERLIAVGHFEAAARFSTQAAGARRKHHAAREALYPIMEQALDRLRAGDSSMLEWAVAYLEADPWEVHSGYFKQKLMRAMRRVPLTEPDRERLRAAILSALPKGYRWEQNETRSLARRLDAPAFRQALSSIAEEHEDEGTRERAAMTLAACRLNDMHHDLRGAVNRSDSST